MTAPEKKIAWKNVPTRLPLFPSMVIWLMLDRFQAPSWGFAVAYTLMALGWIVAIYAIGKEEHIDVFEGRRP